MNGITVSQVISLAATLAFLWLTSRFTVLSKGIEKAEQGRKTLWKEIDKMKEITVANKANLQSLSSEFHVSIEDIKDRLGKIEERGVEIISMLGTINGRLDK